MKRYRFEPITAEMLLPGRIDSNDLEEIDKCLEARYEIFDGSLSIGFARGAFQAERMVAALNRPDSDGRAMQALKAIKESADAGDHNPATIAELARVGVEAGESAA